MTNKLCTQADVEKYLNISFGGASATVDLYITVVSDTIAMICNNDFDAHTDETEYHDGRGKHHSQIKLKNRPVTAVSTVEDDGDSLTVTTHFVWYDNGLLVRVSNGFEDSKTAYWKEKRKGVKVVYDWGYASVPNDIRHACAELVCRLLKRQFKFEEGGVVTSLSMEGISLTFAEVKGILGSPAEDEVAKILISRTKPLIGVI